MNCEKQKNFGFQWVRNLDPNCAHGDASVAAANSVEALGSRWRVAYELSLGVNNYNARNMNSYS